MPPKKQWGACDRLLSRPGSAGLGAAPAGGGPVCLGGRRGSLRMSEPVPSMVPKKLSPLHSPPKRGSGLEGRGLEGAAGQDLRGGSKTGFGGSGDRNPNEPSSPSGLRPPDPPRAEPTAPPGLLLCPTGPSQDGTLCPPAPRVPRWGSLRPGLRGGTDGGRAGRTSRPGFGAGAGHRGGRGSHPPEHSAADPITPARAAQPGARGRQTAQACSWPGSCCLFPLH